MKKILLVIVSLLSIFFLTACGNKEVEKISLKEKNIRLQRGSSMKLELNENVSNVNSKVVMKILLLLILMVILQETIMVVLP